MSDTTIKKIDSEFSPKGEMGQKYLACGKNVSMRLWEKEPPTKGNGVVESKRGYETVGYVLSGKAKLHCEGQVIILEPGNSWVVPSHANHHYEILEEFSAVEATSPPAEVHGRDTNVDEKAMGEITLNFQAGS